MEENPLCKCLMCIISTVGFIFFSLWITSLRAQPPNFYVQSIYFPSLNKTLIQNNDHPIFFTLKIVNPNSDKGVLYDAVSISIGVFVTDNATVSLANATLQGFYQGHGKKAVKSGTAKGHIGGGGGRGRGKVFLRVEVATAVKYKNLVWYSKRHHLWGGANVEMNVTSGTKVSPKGIRLGHVPARFGSGASAQVPGAGILIYLLLILCVCLS
ncbi:hypothetical protein PIB30_057441 [Stylosanthes scabra]|uniref:Late embryogenesis abundant protein LEA-2 subgroup domain-containing protein n=1 Tax=Stylosanthes scabra TaxID=79078 RepID=A0ABU6VMS7_9FABA|nr:hypothetical protein [Stylosanthes scabra]